MTLNFKRAYAIYFSPTRTTKRLCEAMLDVIDIESKEIYDFTTPKYRESFPKLNPDDLVIFGMPTYAGRLPNLMLKYLDTIEGNHAIAIPIVTFGNRAYDSSLYELKEILKNHNFRFLGAAAFSAEHSFSYELNSNRPDLSDLDDSKKFILKLIEEGNVRDDLDVPGKMEPLVYFKPKDRDGNPINILPVKPKTNEKCTRCMACVRNCPMGSIDPKDPTNIIGKCIKCNACVKLCNMHAKYFDDKDYLYHKSELEYMNPEPKPNEYFY